MLILGHHTCSAGKGPSPGSPSCQLLAEVSYRTGGRLYLQQSLLPSRLYPQIEQPNSGLPALPLAKPSEALAEQLLRAVNAEVAIDARVKLRCPNPGVTLKAYSGPGNYLPLTEEAELPAVDVKTSFLFELTAPSPGQAKSHYAQEDTKVSFQFAVLYTPVNRTDIRLVRVHTLNLYATTKVSVLFRHADNEAIAAFYARRGAEIALTNSFANNSLANNSNASDTSTNCNGAERARRLIDNSLIEVLLRYRKMSSTANLSPKGQLILPESLKTLPMYALGMAKHPAFVENRNMLSGVSTGGGKMTSPKASTTGKLELQPFY